MTRTYAGIRRSDGTTLVTVNGRPLDPRRVLRSNGVTTFDWGYRGRGGPAQLALAILADLFGDDERARRHYDRLMRRVISRLPADWVLTGAEVESACPEGGPVPALTDAALLVL
jgi:hypothetical protein